MFKSLKIYLNGELDIEQLSATLIDFGYKRQEGVQQEGDFSRRGSVTDIFPLTFELPVRIETDLKQVSHIRTFSPATGQPLWEHRMLIILPVTKPGVSRARPFSEEFPLENFLDLDIGDYVVHNQHGIGKFLGMEKLKIGAKKEDHLVIEYDRTEKLYVPVKQMHLVQKYIAFQIRRPKLYRLGSREWQRVKDRARKGIQKLAWELLSLQAMRQSVSGYAYAADSDWQKQFEAGFPYKDTPDQAKAACEVKRDMESSKPMDRLLCGDVGYGKTEVAMRAAFKAAINSKQVAFLVPTTILAEQHYQTFIGRLRDFPVNIRMLSRFKTKNEQAKILAELVQGKVDIIIGTHRLLSQDVKFKDLGLVVIDEEQRFGVRAKEKLKTLRLDTDVLTLTATPIPRTLYMSLMGVKDFSVINTPPENRLPVKTIVVEYDQALIRQAIERELKRKGQVYFLHNRVDGIERIRERLAKILPQGVRIAIAHGQMSSRMLEGVIWDFVAGEIDVLVCTMIIQSGIDIPNVNTIFINHAEDFGLSDLHQLRGRVGRFDRKAYAYLLLPRDVYLDSDARKRLDAILCHAHLGAGFTIAMRDLEIRGAGNLLGMEQHGYISAVGFDLYCRLLREAVSNFRKAVAHV